MCRFLNQMKGIKSCSFNITYGENCETPLGVYSSTGPTDSVSLSTPSVEFIDNEAEYCFMLTATSGNNTVGVEGSLNLLTG